jgi:hypothetical protein
VYRLNALRGGDHFDNLSDASAFVDLFRLMTSRDVGACEVAFIWQLLMGWLPEVRLPWRWPETPGDPPKEARVG